MTGDIWETDRALLGVGADTGETPEAMFVKEYVSHGDAMLACSRAGMQDARYRLSVMAERVLARPEIQDAIRAHRLATAGLPKVVTEYTRDLLLDDMQRIAEAAEEDGNWNSAISAKKLQAQLAGLLTQEVNVTHRMAVNELSDEQLMKIVSGREVELSAPAPMPPPITMRKIGRPLTVTVDAVSSDE